MYCECNNYDTRPNSGLPHFVVNLRVMSVSFRHRDIPEMVLALGYCCQFADAIFENSLI